jgi:tetratricopeptide (TPR) repeat protein
VKEIVAMCEYLPLAIENLAAMARTPVQPKVVAAELRAIASGQPDRRRIAGHFLNPQLAGRNRAMEASLLWGYGQIARWAGKRAANIQRAYRLTGVFAGPFTSEDFDAVAGPGEARWLTELQGIYVLDALKEQGQWSQHLFRRGFARQLLEESGELESAESRFFDHYFGLVSREASDLQMPGGNSELLSQSEPNWVHACHMLADRIEKGDAAALDFFRRNANQIQATVYYFTWDCLPLMKRIYAACERMGDEESRAFAANAIGSAYLCQLSEFETAKRWFSTCVDIWKRIGDAYGMSDGLRCLGECCLCVGEIEEGQKLLEEALEVLPSNNRHPAAYILRPLGRTLAHCGNLDRGAELLLAARDAFLSAGSLADCASCELSLAEIAIQKREYANAIAYHRSATKMSKRSGLIREQLHEMMSLLTWFTSWPDLERNRYFSQENIHATLESAKALNQRYRNPIYEEVLQSLEAEIHTILDRLPAAAAATIRLDTSLATTPSAHTPVPPGVKRTD